MRRHFCAFHERKQHRAVLVCHRRAGKTVATVNDLIGKAFTCSYPDGRYAYIGPYYNQVKDVAWTYLKQYTSNLLKDDSPDSVRESELSVLLKNNAKVRLYGGDNPDRLRGLYFDGVVLDEFGDLQPRIWTEIIQPALADRNGWAVIIGTPKGKNAFHEVYVEATKNPDEWFSLLLKASLSGILDANALANLARGMSPDEYQQELECSWEAAIKGAFYADEMRAMLAEQRIRPIAIDQNVRVHTAWDLGVSDSTAIWFIQCVGRERRLIDYYEASGVGLDHYVQVLHDKRLQHGWKYGDHYFPHDIEARELTSGRSRKDFLGDKGIEVTVVPMSNVLDGIESVRRMLGRVYIDEDRCVRGIEALRQYRREYAIGLKDWKKEPLHDWSSHGADALRYFATGFDDEAFGLKRPPPSRASSTPRRSAWGV